jgi:methionine sulfoxide reductase heme-binding subunit
MATTRKVIREAEREANRATTHLLMGIITVAGCYITALLAPNFRFFEVLEVGLAYVSLFFIILTLLIGPLKLAQYRRVPLNLDSRRDIGMWAAATSVVHVTLILWGRNFGGSIAYFFGQFTWFGLVNYLGLFASIIMLGLLLISNDWCLRRLRGPRWKALQRFNYLLFVLVVVHTFGFENIWARGWGIASVVIALTAITLLAQMIGFAVYRLRQQRVKD